MRGGHRQRVTGIGAAQPARRRRIHHLGAARHRRQRHSARQAFRHSDQIGLNAVVLHGEQLAGTGEAGLHFVGDQQDAVLVAQRAQRLHEIGRRHVETALALHRLQHNGRHLLGIDIRFKQAIQAVHRVFGGHAVQRIRILPVEHRAGEWAKAQFVRRHFAGQRHGHIGAAVEAAAEGDQARTAGVSAGDLHRVFHRFRAGGEESGFTRTGDRRALVDALRQRNIAFVRNDLIGGMGEGLQLLFNGGDHLRVTVPGVQHGDPRSKVDHFFAFHIPQRGVLCALGVKTTHHAHSARGGVLTALVQFCVFHAVLSGRCQLHVSFTFVKQCRLFTQDVAL
ncbi:Uncharacterised protein [Acinetobacter baumannii]|nr:Uncharacterised protein [Acinetobacter baumannii]